jgi:hypothetical protein
MMNDFLFQASVTRKLEKIIPFIVLRKYPPVILDTYSGICLLNKQYK